MFHFNILRLIVIDSFVFSYEYRSAPGGKLGALAFG